MPTRPPGMPAGDPRPRTGVAERARAPGRLVRVVGRARVGATAPAMALLLAACSAFTPTTAPSTPTDFAGVVAELENLSIDVNRVVSGEAGCDDERLSRTAIAFDARGLDQASVVRIHLYAFKDQPTYDALRPSVDACARSYVTDPATFGAVDEPPYVLAGSGPWAPAFKDALRTALQRAAMGG